VKNANSVWLNGRPLDTDMAQALVRSVRVENDANCLAVSEAVDGAAAGAAVVWAVILGTGAGSGIAVNGRPLVGRHRITGEWGHNPLPLPRDDERPGPACYCGRQGCLETFVSGTGIAAGHRRRSGQALSAEAIVRAMRAGEPDARRTYDLFLDRLARGLAHVVNILEPDVIVLGGGLSAVDDGRDLCRRALGCRHSSSRTRSVHRCVRASTDRPPACVEPPGCGLLIDTILSFLPEPRPSRRR
jgi:fructokinase